MNLPKNVRLVEVGPRDGLQNEAKPVPVDAKVRLIDALSAAGHSAVEAGSFVSPKWVPQMANTDEVMARIKRKPGVGYPVLVPNKQGMNGAVAGMLLPAADCDVDIEGIDLNAIAEATDSLGRNECATGTQERIVDRISTLGVI